ADTLPPGVPLPPGAQFSTNRQGEPSSSSPTAGLPAIRGMPFRTGTTGGANSLGNLGFANQQPAPITSQPAGASQSMPLTSGATPNWSIVSSPNINSTQDRTVLNGVTCVSASDCWAVGYYSSSADQTLVEHWDGMSWAIISSPNISASTNNNHYGGKDVSGSACGGGGD